MTTTVILIIVGILALGLCAWSWYFENGSKERETTSEKDTEKNE